MIVHAHVVGNATVFTYTLGENANMASARDTPKAIACANYGKWTAVLDGSTLSKEMGTYFEFLQASISTASRVRWSDTFVDESTGQVRRNDLQKISCFAVLTQEAQS
eukprot:SAG31_NODE_143_length_22627_cov_14.541347_12_plen_107_part_00